MSSRKHEKIKEDQKELTKIRNRVDKKSKKVKKNRTLKADTIVKNYWRDNARFADLFNAVLFQGKPVIQPDELEDMDTDDSLVLEHREYAQSIQEMRDNIKVCKRSTVRGVEFVMLGNEAQEHVHYGIPMRIMGYDYGTYRKQYDDRARKYRETENARKGMERDEVLSGIRKEDRLIPVISLVVYYGERPWDGAVSLHGMLEMSEEIAPFVNDYKLLLVEARKDNLKLHNLDNVDLFHLLGIFLDGDSTKDEARERAIKYAKAHEVNRDVFMAMAGVTKRVLDYHLLEEKGEGAMCTFFDQLEAEGEERGHAKGIIEMGLAYGIPEDGILAQLQKQLEVSAQRAKEYYETFGKQTV